MTNDWQNIIATQPQLSTDAAQQLREVGFLVMSGPSIQGGHRKLSDAYDRAVAAADPADVHVGRTGASTRIDDFVNRGPEFDDIYLYPPLLAACRQIIGRPFKLSGMRARTLHSGAPMEAPHVDVRQGTDGWPLVGCIVMIDAFTAENGATRFIPGSHLQSLEPSEATKPLFEDRKQVLACGAAGSVVIFNASVWHGHGANRSANPRRSIQAHFVPREAQSSRDDHTQRMRPETLQRIGKLAKYILNVPQGLCSR